MSGHDTINPSVLMRPTGPWAHGVRVPAGKELLFVTGQVAVRADGAIPEGAQAQAEMVWGNVITVLEAAGMGVDDIVRTGVYVTSAEFLPVVNAARNKVLGDATPATTVLVVPALANPKYLIEVDVIAAK
ncbi:MAG: RidA family protein [Mesorhizobium sp.]